MVSLSACRVYKSIIGNRFFYRITNAAHGQEKHLAKSVLRVSAIADHLGYLWCFRLPSMESWKWPKHCDVCKSFKLTKRKKARPTGFGYSGSQGLFLKYRIHNLLSQERYELFRSSQKLWGFDFKNVTTLRYIGSLMEQDRVHQYSTNPWAEITRREPQSISEVHSWTK